MIVTRRPPARSRDGRAGRERASPASSCSWPTRACSCVDDASIFRAHAADRRRTAGSICCTPRTAAPSTCSSSATSQRARPRPNTTRLTRPPCAGGRGDAPRHRARRDGRRARLHRAPLSAKEALDAGARSARPGRARLRRDVPAVPLSSPYEDYGQPGFEGAKYVMSPPLRPREHQAELWKGLPSTTCRWSRPTTARSTARTKRARQGRLLRDPQRPAGR